jgi:hypothetical protein
VVPAPWKKLVPPVKSPVVESPQVPSALYVVKSMNAALWSAECAHVCGAVGRTHPASAATVPEEPASVEPVEPLDEVEDDPPDELLEDVPPEVVDPLEDDDEPLDVDPLENCPPVLEEEEEDDDDDVAPELLDDELPEDVLPLEPFGLLAAPPHPA